MTSDPEVPASAQGIKSIEVGARVLLALERGRGPLGLSELARASAMHPAKAHRYLVSLVRAGLATQDVTTGTYDLGPAARELGVEVLRRTNAVSVISAHAVALRDQTGHTVNVGVWSDAGPALVRWDTGAHALPIVIRVGSVLPLLDSALGYVFLAYLPASQTRDRLRGQQAEGTTRDATPGEIDALKRSTRTAGLGQTRDRTIFGLAALAAPVFDAAGGIAAALALVLPSRMLGRGQATELGGALRAAAAGASGALGHRHAPDEIA